MSSLLKVDISEIEIVREINVQAGAGAYSFDTPGMILGRRIIAFGLISINVKVYLIWHIIFYDLGQIGAENRIGNSIKAIESNNPRAFSFDYPYLHQIADIIGEIQEIEDHRASGKRILRNANVGESCIVREVDDSIRGDIYPPSLIYWRNVINPVLIMVHIEIKMISVEVKNIWNRHYLIGRLDDIDSRLKLQDIIVGNDS